MSCLSTPYYETSITGSVKVASGRPIYLKRNELILLKSYPFKAVFYIEKGMMRVGGYSGQGKDTTYCLLPEDHIFFSSVHTDSKFVNFAQACTSEVQLRVYQESQIQDTADKDAVFQQDLMSLYKSYIRSTERQLLMLSCSDIRQRIAIFVLFLAELNGYRRQGVTYIAHPFTHSEIGNILNISRQTITQNLRDLQAEGYLHYHRGKFVIPDYEKFQRLSTGD